MKHILAVFIAAASYGILSTFVVLAYDEGYTLGDVVGTQLLVGFILTWLLALFIDLKKKNKVGTGTLKAEKSSVQNKVSSFTWKKKLLLMAAGIPIGLTGLLYYQSLHYVPASLAILLLFQFAWIGVLIESIIKRKRPDKIIYLTLAILFSGTILAAGMIEQGIGKFHILGIVFGLLAAVSYSLFMLFSGKVVPNEHPVTRTKWMLTGGLLFVFIVFPPEFLWNGEIFSSLILFGALLGFFGAFLPPLLFAYGVPHIGEGMAGILGAAELPVAVMLSSLVLHEEVSFLQWIGVVIVLIGVAYPEIIKMRSKKSNAVTSG
ncbi:EamA family transporter [Paenibacillus sp. GSMTC-2017]|uniref:EamA family transporter n=1 Tax=Paenibacillus sp. GSMTC-2017 TaxID=2794350 RepID=UPI0018D6344A|nr:DMT family transporter [Paenibacillus sp. GSMTC-2017]MBH5317691.1 EamA family transporter [Paenibacillus sp. GSMTC-2017]